MKKLIYGTLIIFLFSCNKQDKIIGKWERIGDEYKGLRVEVTQVVNKYVGKLIHITDTAKYFGLELQDVKWKDIVKANNSVYEFKDLEKGYDLFNIISIEYSDAYLTFISNDTIKIRQAVKGSEPWGTQQKWYRMKK